jgi:UDP-glucose 4-epimerase
VIGVIGGAGYIGSLMVKRLRAAGERVVVFDNLSRGHRASIGDAPFVEGDLRRPDDLARLFGAHDIECVMHFAAFASVGESVRVPEVYYDNNVLGCLHLLEAMRTHGVTKMIFSSTAATYGEPVEIPIGEEHPQIPTNPYGETKRVMEQMLRWTHGVHGLGSVSLRYFNAAGADPEGEIGEHHEPEEHLIPNVLAVALGRRESVDVYGTDWPTPDGTCVRDYVHIDDLCQAHYLALERLRQRSVCEAYNLGSDDGASVLEVIRTAEQITGKPIPWRAVARRPGDPARLVASSAKARRELGWKPRYGDLRSIVGHAWQWHRSRPHGYAGAG